MMRIGPLGLWELLIILALVLLVFGPTRLPAMARGVGQAIREFRQSLRPNADDGEADAPVAPESDAGNRRG